MSDGGGAKYLSCLNQCSTSEEDLSSVSAMFDTESPLASFISLKRITQYYR